MNEYPRIEQKKLDEVFVLKEKKQFSEAIAILLPLVKKRPKDKILNGLLATLYYEISNYSLSAKYFKAATLLNPSSELSSLGLFHSLIHLGQIYDAIEELLRFTGSNKYKDYKRTIKELKMNITNFSIEEQGLINNIG